MPHVVILGGGIIGLSTAYYLSTQSQHSSSSTTTTPDPNNTSRERLQIHIVEPSSTLFASASGYAAGFLTKDWFAPSVSPLGEFSFNLHKQLAEEWNGRERWGWSESVGWSLDRSSDEESGSSASSEATDEGKTMTSVEGGSLDSAGSTGSGTTNNTSVIATEPRTDLDWLMSGSSRTTLLTDSQAQRMDMAEVADDIGENDEHPGWLRVKRDALQQISERSTTGQVDPLRLCQFLLERCLANGVILHHPARALKLIKAHPQDPNSPTLIRLEVTYSDAGERNQSSESSHVDSEWSSLPSPHPTGRSELGSVGGSGGYSAQYFRGPGSSFGSSQSSGMSVGSWLASGFGHSNTPHPSLSGARDSSFGSNDFSAGRPPRHHARNTLGKRFRTVEILCDSLVIAAGCWTPRVYQTLFPNAIRVPRVSSLAGYSVVLKSRRWPRPVGRSRVAALATISGSSTSGGLATTIREEDRSEDISTNTPTQVPAGVCHAVFTSDSAGFSPEIFSRTGGDIWVGGLNSSTLDLPALPSDARGMISQSSIRPLTDVAKRLCGNEVEVIREGLCFRPVTSTGKPIIAKMREVDLGEGVKLGGGVYVAAGHGPWGISLSLGTGYVVSEMVLGKEPSVDVSALSRWEAQVE